MVRGFCDIIEPTRLSELASSCRAIWGCVLLSIGQTEPHYLSVVDREKALDTLEVWVEVYSVWPR